MQLRSSGVEFLAKHWKNGPTGLAAVSVLAVPAQHNAHNFELVDALVMKLTRPNDAIISCDVCAL